MSVAGYDAAGAALLLEALGEPLAGVSGLVWDIDADDVRTYMGEVDRQVRELDADVSAAIMQPEKFPLGADFNANEWRSFTWGSLPWEDNPYIPGRQAWYRFMEEKFSTWFGQPVWNTLEVWEQTGAYEKRLIEHYDAFVAAGGRTTLSRPGAGPENPPGPPLTTKDIRAAASALSTIAIIAGIAYALSQVRALRRAAS